MIYFFKLNKGSKLFLVILTLFSFNASAQQRVYPLTNKLAVDSIFEVKPYATKISYDEKSGHLFYSVITGDIYEVFMNSAGGASDSLRYSSGDHGISSLQGPHHDPHTLTIMGPCSAPSCAPAEPSKQSN